MELIRRAGQAKGVVLVDYVCLGKTVEITGWVFHVSVPFPFSSPFLCYVSYATRR